MAYSFIMLAPAYIIGDHLITPLGKNTEETFNAMLKGASGISQHIDPHIGPYYASLLSKEAFCAVDSYTRIESVFIHSIQQTCQDAGIDPADAENLYIFSSTKGNIELLQDRSADKALLRLDKMASRVVSYLNYKDTPLVVSNACISGLQAIELAHLLLQQKTYKRAIVTGCDVFSFFVLTGFYSLQAISPVPCTPFDKSRAGITLGEGCGTILLTLEPTAGAIQIKAVASSNDANHISGPSRTGEGLAIAIQSVLKYSQKQSHEIDFINAHGTGTLYNDEMESLAFQRCNLHQAPVNSIKGYIGHTLGAAGIIETILTAESLRRNQLLPSIGFTESGTSVPLPVIRESQKGNYRCALKTVSGFGGGNSAAILEKEL